MRTSTSVDEHGKITFVLYLNTWVRKEHTDGKYYLSNHIRSTKDLSSLDEIKYPIKEFIRDIYMFQMFGKITPESTDSTFGHKLWPSDVDQRTERKRLLDENPYIKV